MILALSTSSRQMGVALLEGERLVASSELLADYPHAAELPDAVKRVLAEGRARLPDLEAVAVDIGPGSFTGLRIGVAFMKALVFRHRLKVLGVPSLDALAANVPFASRLVCPFLDAKQGNVYAALYRMEEAVPARRTDYLLGKPDEILGLITEPVVLLGDGCARFREAVAARLGQKARVAGQDLWLPRAATVGRLAAARLAAGQQDDPATLVPMYLYAQDCSVNLAHRTSAPAQAAVKAA
jgi:tRNA threonylcarbamoyladenosine biosynthesis protein TsaB